MTDINELVQEFWRTSSDGDVGASFFAMRRLFEILHRCLDGLEVCFDIISIFATVVDLADKNLQMSANPDFRRYVSSPVYAIYSSLPDDEYRIRSKFKILFDAYRKMLHQSFSKSKDFGDMLRFLPGVVVQKHLGIQGMADLYRIKPDLLERLIESIIGPLRPCNGYILDDYLSSFLQDRDRSQLHYCDPTLQHISICRHILSLLGRSNISDFQSY